MSDDVIYFDEEDDDNEDDEYTIDDVDEEVIELLVRDVRDSIDAIEEIVMNLYYSNQEAKEHYIEIINKLELENDSFREEIKKLYQVIASNSKKEE